MRFCPGIFFFIAVLMPGCRQARFSEFRGENLGASRSVVAAGEKAAQRYCAQCHLAPQPESMTQETAHYMLAYMGLFLGVDASRQLDTAEKEHFKNRYELLKRSNSLPQAPALGVDEWKALRAWYLGLARYPYASGESAQPLQLSRVDFADAGVTMLVRLADGRIAAGGGLSGNLVFLDSGLKTLKAVKLDSPPVHLIETDGGSYVLTLGSLLGSLGENAQSSVWYIDHKNYSARRIISGLPRSAHFVTANLNNDGKTDFVVAGFGSVTGGGIIACESTRSAYTQKIISRHESIVRLVVLQQGTSGITLLALAGGAREALLKIEYAGGVAREKTLSEYPPHLGSVWLDAADLDGDGVREILVLSGDNADAGPYNEVKPDQGLRIYQLDNEALRQVAFESLPGALSLALTRSASETAIAVSRFYADPASRQDLTLLRAKPGFKFSRQHFTLDSRPTVLTWLDNATLLIGAGNVPVATLHDGKVQVREFSGTPLGRLKIATK